MLLILLCIISLQILPCSCLMNDYGVREVHDNAFVHSVTAVQGMIARLPCDITTSFPGDKLHIIVWFKENENGTLTAIYSFDSRDSMLLEKGKHWSDELILGGRAYFRFQDVPAKLAINNVLFIDAGIYQCRVDFNYSPTKFSKVKLKVVVPPDDLTILNSNNVEIDKKAIGPYNEGMSVKVICISTGGTPSPKLTWWQENALLDDSYETILGNQVRNVLYIEKLQRKHLHKVLTCQASNNEVMAPISKSLYIELNSKTTMVDVSFL